MKHFMLLALLATSAYADTRVAVTWGEPEPKEPTALVRLGDIDEGRVERASLLIRSDATSMRVQLTLSLTTSRTAPTDLHVPLLVPRGTQVTHLDVAIGLQQSSAHIVAASAALERYERIVSEAQDPGLVRWIATDKARTQLEVRAFPVTHKTPASVTLQMTLPRAAKLVFDPGAHRLAQLDVTAWGPTSRFLDVTMPSTIEIPTERASWMTEDKATRPYVDARRSLFAGFSAPPPNAPRIARPSERRRSEMPTVVWTDRKRELRDHLRERQEALAHCYAYGVELEPTLLPWIDLAITIDADGSVSDAEVTGDMDSDVTRACVADEVRSWKFRNVVRSRVVRESIDLRF